MKIKELVLLTNDLKQTKDFYSGKLNLEVLSERTDSASFSVGSTTLAFRQSVVKKPVYHFAFNISNNKIEEALQWCEVKGFEILCYHNTIKLIDFPNWNAKSIYFLDNNGNILEFIARFDLPTESNLPFNEKQILNVGEIGMVVDDVKAFCEEVMKKYRIPYYEKQKPAPDFSVMGDAEGLFIVVPEHRKWFPTGVVSRKFPVEAVLEEGGVKWKVKNGF
jgi:catechol 2,3-dioxygenase-like lactoylglutathione lyase family enzyme